ncbi:hypothetical protein CC78DRAFT_202039 [Lojkania enalia]|uniref:Uncharacterized protein n=1 Tax=Lojkania enalia TaxID=147567 RepID=A0A9P4MWZ3_9PLEO|nr:hypothetical protein CC78DRAFT_202039 [Didymosphaeria enalia]
MPQNILLSQFFLPLSAVGLGRFVISFDEPHQDFHEPYCTTRPNVTETVQVQYDSIRNSIKHLNIALQLTSFLSSTFSKRLKASIRITAEQVKTYYLNNVGQWFRDAMKLQETREWIERTIDEGEDIYIIVAYHTLVNARIITQKGGQNATGGTLAVPMSTALMASGVVIPFANAVDPGLGGFRGRVEDGKQQFIAPGEHIFAVQYRKVRCRWFWSKKVDQMTLAKDSCWKIYDGPRNLQSEPEDMIGVELEDELALERDYEECTIDSGEAYVSLM